MKRATEERVTHTGKDGRTNFVEFVKTTRGKWFWRQVSRNGRTFAVGTDRHADKGKCWEQYVRVCLGMAGPVSERPTDLLSECYKDRKGKWRWRLLWISSLPKKDPVAASYESFSSKWSANKGLCASLQAFKRHPAVVARA